jgi:hypothetical protein
MIKNIDNAGDKCWYMDIVRLLHKYTVDPFDSFWFLIKKIRNTFDIEEIMAESIINKEIMESTDARYVPTNGHTDQYKFVKLTMDLIYGEQ